ncbi:MAG: tetratricopeptide repeat protein [Balneolaceae bacterium]
MSYISFVIIFYGLVFSGSVIESAPDTYEIKLERGIEAFYKADWRQARSIFNELKEERPEDPAPYFFESMMPFWKYFFVDQNEETADAFFSLSEEAIRLSEIRLKNSPDDTTMVLFLSGLYGYRSLVAAGENRYSEAVQDGITGYKFTRKLLSVQSDRPEAKIGKGMYYYMTGSIPGEVKWAANMFGVRGDVEYGLAELKKAAESNSLVSNDSKMILMYLYSKEERFDEALLYADRLIEQFPRNVIIYYKKAQILDRIGKTKEAFALFRKIININHPDLTEVTKKAREYTSVKKTDSLTLESTNVSSDFR